MTTSKVKRPAFQFYPRDWLGDTALRTCSIGARGLWMDMLSFMHEGEPYGYLRLNGKAITPEALARMVGETTATVKKLLRELTEAGVPSIDADGSFYSRRMVRDEHNRNVRAAGGYASLENPNVPQPKDSRKDGRKDTSKDRHKDHSKDPNKVSLPGSFGVSPASASASALASASKSGAEAEGLIAAADAGFPHNSNGAAPPAPPADAGLEQPPRLPAQALRVLSLMPDDRRDDGTRQLLAALGPIGTRLGKGADAQYVRAYNAAHLAHCCQLTLDAPPDKPALLVYWVLVKLRDTFTEWRARDDKRAAATVPPEVTAIVRQAIPTPVDELDASLLWLLDHPEIAKEIDALGAEKWADFGDSAKIRRQRYDWQDRQGIERWRAAGSPAPHATASTGERS